VLPKRQLFSREKQEPSASIVLKMKGPTRLSREQVTSVQHLVAAAVPSLSPQRISIVDDKGNLLARGFEGGPGGIGDTAEEKRLTYETRLARTLEEMLEKTVGFGKVRAEVRAEMDFDRVVTNEEKFDPEGQVVRSTQTVDDRSSSRDGETTPVSVGQNLPDANAETAGGAAASAARTEETVNYEISKRIVNHVRESGIVKRLSVAVLIDGISEPGPDGQRTYRPRGNEEMEQLATLVRGAIGFNSARGDSVEVVNMRFAAVEEAPEPPLDLFFGLNKNDLLRMAEILVLSIVAILVILLVVRPLVTKAFEAMPAAISAAEGRLLAERTAQAALAAPGAGPVPVPTEAPGEEEEGFEELIDIDRVEGRVKASSVKKVGEIVDKHPEEALAIVRNWMYQET
jgi:flagellar M-ring protein FliF